MTDEVYVDDLVKAPELPTEEDAARAGDYLRAAALPREWLSRNTWRREGPFALAHRAFILGYLAGTKDRT